GFRSDRRVSHHPLSEQILAAEDQRRRRGERISALIRESNFVNRLGRGKQPRELCLPRRIEAPHHLRRRKKRKLQRVNILVRKRELGHGDDQPLAFFQGDVLDGKNEQVFGFSRGRKLWTQVW